MSAFCAIVTALSSELDKVLFHFRHAKQIVDEERGGRVFFISPPPQHTPPPPPPPPPPPGPPGGGGGGGRGGAGLRLTENGGKRGHGGKRGQTTFFSMSAIL
jgi:hypothetical protein